MSETSTKKSPWKIVGILLGIAALIGTAFYFFFPHLDMKVVKQNISDFAATAEDPAQSVSLEYILLQGVNEIRWRRSSYLACKKVASAGNIPIEQVIVDAAINQAREYGYIS